MGIGSLLEYIEESGDARTKNWPFVDSYLHPLWTASLYYLIVTKIGPQLMRSRNPFHLKPFIMVYNLAQVILCAYYLKCYGLGLLMTERLSCMEIVTGDQDRDNLMARLSWYYYMLKFLDLMDTIFFVLTKKQRYVTFLHLFHHISMIFVTWFAVKFYPSGALMIATVLNCTVHTFMYFYYFCTLYFGSVPLQFKKAVTSLQLVQFLIGTSIMFVHLVNPYCNYPKWYVIPNVLHGMYFTYLFGNFYYKTYVVDVKLKKGNGKPKTVRD